MKTSKNNLKIEEQISCIVLFMVTTYALSIIWTMSFISLMIPISFVVIVTLMSTKEFSNKKSQILFIMIILVKFLVMIYQAGYKNIPMGGNDWEGYNRHATTLLYNSENFFEIMFSGNVDLFSRIIGIIYFLLGSYLPLVNLFVFITSISLVKYIHKLSVIITQNYKLGDYAGLLFTIWPISFIFSITVLREIPIQWATTVSLYHFIMHIKTTHIKHLLGAIIFSIIAAVYHSGMIGIVLIYFGVLSFYNVKKSRNSISLKKVIAFSIIGIIVFVSPLGDLIMQKFSSIESAEDLIARTSYAAGRTVYVTMTPNNIRDIVIQTPYRLILFALSPLPWHLRGMDTILAWIIDAVPQLVSLYYVIKWSIKYKPQSSQEKIIKKVFILIILITYLMNAWGTANYGTAMRHRAKMLPLQLIITVWYLSLNKIKERIRNYA